MKSLLPLLFIFLLCGGAAAQTQTAPCHVYVVDVLKARQALESFRETGNPAEDRKALTAGQTVFPEFSTVIGEEKLTTRTFKFPGSNLVITASAYYTDESMASSQGRDSIVLGIRVSRRPSANALVGENNALAEVTHNDATDTVRAKQYVRVNRRLYLVGIECHYKPRSPS